MAEKLTPKQKAARDDAAAVAITSKAVAVLRTREDNARRLKGALAHLTTVRRCYGNMPELVGVIAEIDKLAAYIADGATK